MSRIKLYLDEDAQRTDLIQGLRARNIDVSTVTEANSLGQPDNFQLQYATEQDRVIFTFIMRELLFPINWGLAFWFVACCA